MELISKIHGKIQYDEKDIIIFEKGLPGFENLKKFIIFNCKEYEPFKLLHSIENSEIALVVTSPYEFEPQYEINLDDNIVKHLNIENPEQVLIIVTVTLNSDVKKMTMNLQGPIVINTSNNLGEQIILEHSQYKIKTPLMKEE